MNMLTYNYKKWNIIGGWLCFIIALVTYSLTVEPTVSFWDPGEYISTSAKLQVGHPPGAPLYQMLGAFFAMFATSAQNVALMVNMVAVFSSAFTILFMFWISSNILKKIVEKNSALTNINSFVILGSAAIGSLAFTFSDSFWFNAVEAEVYASAMFLIALLLYLGLRWVDDIDNPRGDKWILLIALIAGCSFGIHLMGLLAIPSIVLLYYFRTHSKITIKNFIIANIVAVVVLFFLFAFLFPYILALFGRLEIFMVNSIGLPFNSGTIFAFLLIVAFFVGTLTYTKKKGFVKMNTAVLALLFVCVGLTSWIMLPIRANAKVVINENTPSDAAELLAYYQREQYGSESIYYDSYFTKAYVGLDQNDPFKDDKPNYERDYNTGKYVIVNEWKNAGYNFNKQHKGFLPRLWSTDTNHRLNYMRYTRPLDFKVKQEYAGTPELEQLVRDIKGQMAANELGIEELDQIFQSEYNQYLDISVPTFADNMSFMVNYQFGYMFWRYLMWNFTGRQDDIQGQGDLSHGNWLSGIKFLDEIRLGSQSNLPESVLDNKGRNTYYFLPFILGLIGFIFHFRKDKRTFWVLLVLFLFTSLALKVFLNERPFEPRERDYAVVPAFFVFAIWLGFGVYAIYEGVSKFLTPKISAPLILGASLFAAPILMAQQNWDDHDRSNRYTAWANAKAYLDSCAPNAILFTIGDNDTFPLWYLQEIEGYRTDVRVVCTSLLPLDWYIDQMKAKTYESEPLPIKFTHDQYVGNKRDYVLIQPITDKSIDVKLFMDFIRSEDKRLQTKTQAGTTTYLAPTNKVTIPVNKEIIAQNNIVSPYLMDQVVDSINVEIKDSGLYKHRLIMLDIIANNNWERPIYFSGGSYNDEDYLWMKDYLQLNGITYQLVPIKTENSSNHPIDMGSIDSDKMYDIVSKWDWGNMGSDKIYHDPQTRKNSNFYRINLARLMEQLIEEGKLEKANDIIDIAMQNMPLKYFNEHRFTQSFVQGYYQIDQIEKARELANESITLMLDKINYYKSLPIEDLYYYSQNLREELELYGMLMQIIMEYDEEYSQDLAEQYMSTMMEIKSLNDLLQ